MTDITTVPPAGTLLGDELIPMLQDGEYVSVTPTDIYNFTPDPGDEMVPVPAAYAWRMRALETAHDAVTFADVGVGELSFLDSSNVNKSNLYGNGAESCSTVDTPGWQAYEAFDGDYGNGNGWYSKSIDGLHGVGQWLAWTRTDAQYTPAKVAIRPINNYPRACPKSVAIECFSGGIWVHVMDITFATPLQGVTQTFDLPTEIPASALNGGLAPTKVISKWKDKAVLVVGDSFTSEGDPTKNWADWLAATTGATVTKLATSGIKMDQGTDAIQAYNTSSFALICILLGVNDYYNNTPIGAWGDVEATNTFYGDVTAIIGAALDDNKATQVAMFTPTMRTDITAANTQGKVLKDYVDVIVDVCGRLGIPVCDFFRRSGFSTITNGTLTYDNLHPNAVGAQRLGEQGAGWLNTI